MSLQIAIAFPSLSDEFMAAVTLSVAAGNAQSMADRIELNLLIARPTLSEQKIADFEKLLAWLRKQR